MGEAELHVLRARSNPDYRLLARGLERDECLRGLARVQTEVVCRSDVLPRTLWPDERGQLLMLGEVWRRFGLRRPGPVSQKGLGDHCSRRDHRHRRARQGRCTPPRRKSGALIEIHSALPPSRRAGYEKSGNDHARSDGRRALSRRYDRWHFQSSTAQVGPCPSVPQPSTLAICAAIKHPMLLTLRRRTGREPLKIRQLTVALGVARQTWHGCSTPTSFSANSRRSLAHMLECVRLSTTREGIPVWALLSESRFRHAIEARDSSGLQPRLA